MLPTKLTAIDPESERRRYKIVRCDTCVDVPGLIISADAETGICALRCTIDGKSTDATHNFGPDGLRIVVAR